MIATGNASRRSQRGFGLLESSNLGPRLRPQKSLPQRVGLNAEWEEGRFQEDGATSDAMVPGWEDVEGVDIGLRPGACAWRSKWLAFTSRRSLFRDSDTTDEGDEDEEFTGFSGNLGDLNSDEEAEEYVSLPPFVPTHTLRR
jgi:hypothetical protein